MRGVGPREQAGSASLPVLTMVAVLVLVGTGLAWVGGAVVAQRRAQAAADLAALAAATALVRSAGACEEAERVARANGASLRSCRVGGAADVRIAVRLRGPDLVGRELWVDAEARAGPLTRPPAGVRPSR